MTRFLLLLFLLRVYVTVSMDLQKRIIGGRVCGPNERHYHVNLEITNGTHSSHCGASLISNQWILTAAHCWIDGWSIHPVFRVPQSNLPTITEHKIYKKKRSFFSIKKKHHDIMLLKLSQTTKNIRPVNLPNCRNRPNVLRVQVAGHGPSTADANNIKHGTTSPTLQCAEMDVVDCSQVEHDLKNSIEFYKEKKYQHWFCGAAPGVDTCRGDSGGGVVANNMIYGVIAFGYDEVCRGPAAFMDLCHPDYEKWLTDNISDKKKVCGLFGCG